METTIEAPIKEIGGEQFLLLWILEDIKKRIKSVSRVREPALQRSNASVLAAALSLALL